MSVKKTVTDNWQFFAIVAVVAALVALCMAGYLAPYGYQCCNWLDPNCPGCSGGADDDVPETIVEECASCAETTFPNCAGECEGSTEQRPLVCAPFYETGNIQMGGGTWSCQCQSWYGDMPQ